MSSKPKFYTFVLDQMADWEAAFILPLITSSEKYELLTFGLTRNPIRTKGQFHVTPDVALSEVTDPAFILIPGGWTWSKSLPEHEPLYAKLKEWHEKKIPIGGICDGTLALARAGILNRVKHTGNPAAHFEKHAPGYDGKSKIVSGPATTDQGVVTASGEAAIEFTYEIMNLLELYSAEDRKGWLQAFKHPETY